jgi:hypothetical protein
MARRWWSAYYRSFVSRVASHSFDTTKNYRLARYSYVQWLV